MSCIANPANLTKWSSINVTGVDGLTTPADGQMSSVTQVQNSSSNGTNSTMASSIVVNSTGITSSLNIENSCTGGSGGDGGDANGGDGKDGQDGEDGGVGADGADGGNCAVGADGGDAGSPTTADEDDEEEEEDDCNIGDAGFPFCDGRLP